MKRKVLKFIAVFTVFFSFTIERECRLALIEYKRMKLTNIRQGNKSGQP